MADTGLTHDAWLERVPQLVDECVEEWGLRLGEPYAAGAAGYAVRAERADGAPAVLKVIFPHREAEHEATALRAWNGDGAVRLLDYDEARWAMLIERCEPGTLLARADPDTALDVFVSLLPRLWLTEPGPFRPRTIDLGGFVGVFHGDELVAMAGQRLRPPGYCEVSSVCTHPDARRRGYAAFVSAHVADEIRILDNHVGA